MSQGISGSISLEAENTSPHMTLFYQFAPHLCPPPPHTHTMDIAACPGTWSPHTHRMPCPTLGTKTSDLLPALLQFQGRGQRSWEQRALTHIPTLNYQTTSKTSFPGKRRLREVSGCMCRSGMQARAPSIFVAPYAMRGAPSPSTELCSRGLGRFWNSL